MRQLPKFRMSLLVAVGVAGAILLALPTVGTAEPVFFVGTESIQTTTGGAVVGPPLTGAPPFFDATHPGGVSTIEGSSLNGFQFVNNITSNVPPGAVGTTTRTVGASLTSSYVFQRGDNVIPTFNGNRVAMVFSVE